MSTNPEPSSTGDADVSDSFSLPPRTSEITTPIRPLGPADDPDATNASESPYWPQPAAVLFGWPKVPGYEVLDELGHGGMGVVYKAVQTDLKRVVALKMIRAGKYADAEAIARFRTEAEAMARLQHPNIVQVYEVGEYNGLPYFSLEFCSGGSLDKKIKVAPLHPKEAAKLVEALARAMHAAHQRQVVHRDLKPANVLLTEDGTPKVTDFGLAKQLDAPGLTQTGKLMGTPSYMAPEQARGQRQDIGPAVDVYALGAILYDCLTGRPPFLAADWVDILSQVLSSDPVAPTRLHFKVPRDLETICLKCLRKEPAKRYASAADLAEDLRRFQAEEPIKARPLGATEQALKWVKRRPAVAGLLAVLVLLTATAATLLTWQYGQVVTQKEIAEKKEQDALDQKEVADANAARARQAEARATATAESLEKALEATRLAQAATQRALVASKIQLVDATLRDPGLPIGISLDHLNTVPTDQRFWEWHYLRRKASGGLFTLHGHTGGVESLAYSPDGQRLASGSADNTVKVWDAHTGTELLVLKGHTGPVRSLAFSADSRRLASAGGPDGMVKVWDVQTGAELFALKGHTGPVSGMAFSADGLQLASAGSGDNTIKVWDAHSGAELLSLRGHLGPVFSVAYSPDGRRLATGSADRTVKVWDAHSGAELLTLRGQLVTGHMGPVFSAAFSPDGRRLVSAAGGLDRTLKVWDAHSGAELLTLRGHVGPVRGVAYSPDGRRFATAGEDHTVKVWDAHSGAELLTLRGHTGLVFSVVFSPDGRQLASGSADRTVKLWDAHSGTRQLTFKRHRLYVHTLAFSPDGRRLATGSEESVVKIWDAHNATELLSLRGHVGPVRGVAFSPDSRRLASVGGADGTVKVWDAQSGALLLNLRGHFGPVVGVVYHPDGQQLASAGGADGLVKVWDAQSGAEVLVLKGQTRSVTSVAYSPDGRRLAAAEGADGTVKIWDARSGAELLPSLKGHGGLVFSLAFSPDGRQLVSGSVDSTVKVWDIESGSERLSLRGNTGSVRSVTCSPDGRRLASVGGTDGGVKIWDAQSGAELLTLKGTTGPVLSVRFSPDGRQLASAEGADGTVKVWSARGEAEQEKPDAWELGYRAWTARPDPSWHQEEARQDEQAGHWFAAAFHLRQAVAHGSPDGRLYARLGQAEAQLSRWEAAAGSYLMALTLDPMAVFAVSDPTALMRGMQAANNGSWEQAATAFARAVRHAPNNAQSWHGLLLAHLALSRHDAYRACCSYLLDRFGSTDNSQLANNVAYWCILAPQAVEESGRVVQLAQRAVDRSRQHNSLNTLGAALHRAGRHEEAVKILDEGMQLQGKGGVVQDWLFLALAHHHLRHAGEARQWLDKAAAFLDQAKPRNWQERLEWQLLRQEAEALIRPKKP